MAAAIARIKVKDLVLQSAVGVLRLAMLLALRQGDVDISTEHARRLMGVRQIGMGLPAGGWVEGGSRPAAIVNRLVEELHQVLGKGAAP